MLVLSAPHRLVDCVLRRQCAFKGGIFSPASGNIAKIALADSVFGQTCTANQSVDRNVIQTLALLPCAHPKSCIKVIRNITDRVLHAPIVGTAGKYCKQRWLLPDHINRHGDRLRWHAGVVVAGLVAKACVHEMIAASSHDMRLNREFARVDV